MALAEFTAMEAAYRALVDLEPAARTRALGWLTDALATPGALPQAPATTPTQSPRPTADREAAPSTPPPAVRRRSPTRPTPKPTPTVTAKATKKAPAAKPTKASRPAAANRDAAPGKQTAAAKGERAYRRMPPAGEVLGAYRQVGTISGLAEHFNVPAHTIQGWARRLRKEGHDIGRTS